MALRERLIYAIEVVTEKASAGLKGFKSDIAAAEGAANKFRAGAASAMSTVGVSAGLLATAAGTAIAAFGAKSVASFESMGLAAGKFAASSDLSTESASRWQEVAQDLGVNADTVATSFARLQKAIGANSPAVKELGLEVQRGADGQVDANATMLEAIRLLGGVTDANKKAELAAGLFGRGFHDSAQLLLGNADEIKKRLSEVSSARVLSPAEVKTAEQLRDALANLRDTVEAVEIAFGQDLTPTVAATAEDVTALIQGVQWLSGWLDHLPGDGGKAKGFFQSVKDAALGAIDPIQQYKNVVTGVEQLQAEFGASAGDTASAFDLVSNSADAAKAAYRDQQDALAKIAAGGDVASSAFNIYAQNIEHAAEATEQQTKAEKDAKDALDAHNEALQRIIAHQQDYARAQLSVADAEAGLAQAQDDLNTLLTEGTVTAEQKASADKSVADAQSSQADAAQNLRDAHADLNRVIASGIPTDEQKAASLRKVEDAQRGVEDAIRGVDRAQRNAESSSRRLQDLQDQLAELNAPQASPAVQKTTAYKKMQQEKADAKQRADLLQSINDAEQNVADSQLGVSDAQRNVKDATDKLNSAQADNNKLLTDGIDIADQKRSALDRVHDAEKRLRQAVDDTKDAQKRRDDLLVNSIATDAQKEQATRNVRQAQLDLTSALDDQAAAFAAQSGAVDGTTASLALQRQEMQRIIDLSPQYAAALQPSIDLINAAGGGAVFSQLPVGAREGGTAGNYTINMYGTEATPAAVIDAIKKWERINGIGWRA